MNFAHGCKVQTKHRVGGNQHIDVARQFAGQHRTLHVATREAANRSALAPRLDAVLGNPGTSAGAPGTKAKQAMPRQRRLIKVAQRHVLGHTECGHTGVAQRFFRQAANLEAVVLPPGGAVGLAHYADLSAQARPLSDQGLDQLALAVARHAGHPQNFSGVHAKVHAVQGQRATVAQRSQRADLEHRRLQLRARTGRVNCY